MRYNLYLENFSGSFNILYLSKEQLDIVVEAYRQGKPKVSFSGQTYHVKDLNLIRIFEHDITMDKNDFIRYCKSKRYFKSDFFVDEYLLPDTLSLFGKEVTEEVIGNIQYGVSKSSNVTVNHFFVNEDRINELRNISSSTFDLKRLVCLCEEINSNFNNGNFLSVAMLGRTIINHIPPIFGYLTFNEVANNSSIKSFKKSMLNLNNSMKNIADSFLHQTIREKESLPNETQVNFSQDLDVLLGEIVRLLK